MAAARAALGMLRRGRERRSRREGGHRAVDTVRRCCARWQRWCSPRAVPGLWWRGEPLCATCAWTVRPAPPPPAAPASTACWSRSPTRASCVSSWRGRKYRRRHAALAWLADAMVVRARRDPRRGRRRDLGADHRRPPPGGVVSTRPSCSPSRSTGRARFRRGRCSAASVPAIRRAGRGRERIAAPDVRRSGRRRLGRRRRVAARRRRRHHGATLTAAADGAARRRARRGGGTRRGPPALSRAAATLAAGRPHGFDHRPAGAAARRDRRRHLRAPGRRRRRVARRLDRRPEQFERPARACRDRDDGGTRSAGTARRREDDAGDRRAGSQRDGRSGGRRRQPPEAGQVGAARVRTSGASRSSSPRSATLGWPTRSSARSPSISPATS